MKLAQPSYALVPSKRMHVIRDDAKIQAHITAALAYADAVAVAPNARPGGRFDAPDGFVVQAPRHAPIRRVLFSPERLAFGTLAVPLVAFPGDQPGGLLAEAARQCHGGRSGYGAAVAQRIEDALRTSATVREALRAAEIPPMLEGQQAAGVAVDEAFVGLFVSYEREDGVGEMHTVPWLVVQGGAAEAAERFYEEHIELESKDQTWGTVFGGKEWADLVEAAATQRCRIVTAALSALGLSLTSALDRAVETATNVVVPSEESDALIYHSGTTPVHTGIRGVVVHRTASDMALLRVPTERGSWMDRRGAWQCVDGGVLRGLGYHLDPLWASDASHYVRMHQQSPDCTDDAPVVVPLLCVALVKNSVGG